uniref:Venom redulysin 3 n=1 Tax=Oncocephalus sp. TaxID=2944721 RepID=A0AB38ZEE7_9HEMI
MSKFWLLLLCVSAFQAVHSYPALEDYYLEDPAQSTWEILKEGWDKLSDKYNQMGKDAAAKFIAAFKNRFCKNIESDEDFEEDQGEPTVQVKLVRRVLELLRKAKKAIGDEKKQIKEEIEGMRRKICSELNDVEEDLDEMEEDPQQSTWSILKDAMGKLKDRWTGLAKEKQKQITDYLEKKFCSEQNDFEEDVPQGLSKSEIVQKIQDALKSLKDKYGNQKDKMIEEVNKLKQRFCAQLIASSKQNDVDEDEGDEERGINWGKWADKIKKGLKKISKSMLKGMKKGAKFLKDKAIKVTPIKCEGKSCKSCISLTIPMKQSVCAQFTLLKTNKATYLIVALTVNDEAKLEQKIKIGEVPRCMNIGEPIGKLCMKGLEGKAKSSKGQANANFCLVILAEKYNCGVKICAKYEDKKFKVKFSPKLFAGGQSEDGDIVELDEKEESGVTLDADEFEIDE